MERDYRRLLVSLAVAGAGLVAVGVFWAGIHSSVRWALWSTIADQSPNPGEHRRLGECKPPGWWTWLKILSQDRVIQCGEVWGTEALATKVTGGDREAWLQEWVRAPESSAQLRLRSALALTLAGRRSPAEPAWLSLDPELPQGGPGSGLAAAVAGDRAWGVHLGPRWMALGTLWALSESGLPPAEALAPVEAIWAVGDPELNQQAVSAVARGLSVPPDLLEDVRYRRTRGLPARDLPREWVEAIFSRPSCEAPCLELWIELLRMEAEAELGGEPTDEELAQPTLQPLSDLLGYTGPRRRALEWWVQAATRWVAVAPDPAGRLASLGEGGASGTADPIDVFWSRSAAPITTALVLTEVGERTGIPVQVRIEDSGAVWIDVGHSEQVIRPPCEGSAAELPPQSPPWDRRSLVAGALGESIAEAVEAQQPMVALRLATAAQRLAPQLAEGLPDRVAGSLELSPDTVLGHAIGAEFATELPEADPTVQRSVATFLGERCAP